MSSFPRPRSATLRPCVGKSSGRCAGVERLAIIGALFVVAELCEIGGGYLVWG